jgi:hypothetical protein
MWPAAPPVAARAPPDRVATLSSKRLSDRVKVLLDAVWSQRRNSCSRGITGYGFREKGGQPLHPGKLVHPEHGSLGSLITVSSLAVSGFPTKPRFSGASSGNATETAQPQLPEPFAAVLRMLLSYT